MNLVCDLDGVVYRGHAGIPGSGEALRRAERAGFHIWFATNNSTGTPAQVQAKLKDLTGFETDPASIVTSAQAAASMIGPEDHPALVFGSEAISEALAEVGASTTESPGEAASVVVGLDRRLNYERLAAACDAVRAGARFVATNVDPTFPIDGGFLPGSGTMVAAVVAATDVQPEVAGKPHLPMRRLLRSRGVDRAWVVGDRLDTDIALATEEEGWRSVLVLTGVARTGDDATAADHVAPDLVAAIDIVLAVEERG